MQYLPACSPCLPHDQCYKSSRRLTTDPPIHPSIASTTQSRNKQKVDVLRASSPAEALKFSSEELMGMLRESTNSLKRFTTGGMEGLTGPLGIVQVGADLAAVDQLALVKFAAFISVNLAVVNALPFPGLDGGQMVFVLLEAVRGRRLSPRLENGINFVAVLLLASLSLTLIFGDITRGTSPIERVIEANPLLDSSPR